MPPEIARTADVPPRWLDRLLLASWRPYALIGAAGFALYFRVLSFGYVYLDDNSLILDRSPRLNGFAGVLDAFRSDIFHSHGGGAFYRPVFALSLGLDAWLRGASPVVYHLDNVVVHLAAAGLVFALLARLGYSRGTALFCALLFDVHPVLSQAVAWIPGRNDSLAAVFVLSAFLPFAACLDARRERAGGWCLCTAHVLFFALALFTKETAVASIGVFLVYAFLLRKERERGALAACAVGWLAVLAAYYALRRGALVDPLRLSPVEMARSIGLNLPGLLQSAGKILLPVNLAVLATIGDTGLFYGAAASLAVLGALATTPKKRWRNILFGLCWFVLFFLPSMLLRSTKTADIALEHRSYLPIIGFLIVLMETAAARDRRGRSAVVLGALVLAVFSTVTWRRLDVFKDRLVFWRSAVGTSPHLPWAHVNLGTVYYMDGDLARAAAEFSAASALNPREPMVHNDTGLIFLREGRIPEAEREFKAELAINPDFDNALFNLGQVYYHLGRPAQAESFWEKTLKVNPDYAGAYYGLIVLSIGRRDHGAAARYAERLRSRGLTLRADIAQILAASK